MIAVYDTKTGLGKKFAEKLGLPVQSVAEALSGPCILITRNVGYGMIPGPTKRFLKQHGNLVQGVVVNGDRRYGKFFCAAGPKITAKYGLPVLRNIEGEGNPDDAAQVKAAIAVYAEGVLV